ncbi:MAG TPA: PilZ domain-containing protein [Kofleriaceae bacterium]|nr:PilZ domain-containing protein [Kofleriaceae bacterium]
MTDHEKRGSERVPVALRIRLRYQAVDQFISKFAVNVSRGGMFLSSRNPKAPGTRIYFEIWLADDSPVIDGSGEVRWIREYDRRRPDEPHGMGIQFIALSDSSWPLLERILAHRRSIGEHDDDAIPEPRPGIDRRAPARRDERVQAAAPPELRRDDDREEDADADDDHGAAGPDDSNGRRAPHRRDGGAGSTHQPVTAAAAHRDDGGNHAARGLSAARDRDRDRDRDDDHARHATPAPLRERHDDDDHARLGTPSPLRERDRDNDQARRATPSPLRDRDGDNDHARHAAPSPLRDRDRERDDDHARHATPSPLRERDGDRDHARHATPSPLRDDDRDPDDDQARRATPPPLRDRDDDHARHATPSPLRDRDPDDDHAAPFRERHDDDDLAGLATPAPFRERDDDNDHARHATPSPFRERDGERVRGSSAPPSASIAGGDDEELRRELMRALAPSVLLSRREPSRPRRASIDGEPVVRAAMARARALTIDVAGDGELDRVLAELLDQSAVPVEISVEAASRELAERLGGAPVERRRTSETAAALARVPAGRAMSLDEALGDDELLPEPPPQRGRSPSDREPLTPTGETHAARLLRGK